MILLYVIATYSPEMARWSRTVLGKLFAVAIILLYSVFDIVSGLLACALVVFYYQTDYVESFQVYSLKETDDIFTENEGSSLEGPPGPEKSFASNSELEIVEDAYPLEPKVPILYDKKNQEFRQKHCKNGHLIYKGQIVKPEMAEHIYEGIEQAPFHKCNICDPACPFNLTLVEKEDELMHPKSSNDWFDRVWTNNISNKYK